METVEVMFLRKKFYFQSDEPETFRRLCNQLTGELDLLFEQYPNFSREQLLLLYMLRRREGIPMERKEEPIEPKTRVEEYEAEQLGVDLDEINDILNTDI